MTSKLNRRPFIHLILVLILLFITLIWMNSCSPSFYCSKCPTKDSTYIKIKDSMVMYIDTSWFKYYNPADSLSLTDDLHAYIDSLGKCKIKDDSGVTESGKIKIKYIVRNNKIFVECNTKAYELEIAQLNTTVEKYHSMYISSTKTATVTTKRPRTWWEWLGYWQSWVCMGFIAIVIIRFILKKLNLKLGLSTIFPYINISTK